MRIKYNQYRHKVDEPMIHQYWFFNGAVFAPATGASHRGSASDSGRLLRQREMESEPGRADPA